MGSVMPSPMDYRSGERPAGARHGTRSPVLARRGVIATSQPIASAAGLQVLQAGGNAVDAAVTAAAVLAVIEPSMTGIGGDLFALVHHGPTGRLEALDASGRSGSGATPEALAGHGLEAVPVDGPLSVTVPGVIDGWARLLERFGTIGLDRALAPAIRYARDGFAVHEIVAGEWATAAAKLARDPAAAATFLSGGRAPHHGEIFANPHLARTLEAVATEGPAAFYSGTIGRAIAEDLRARGAFVTADDLAAHASEWVTPLHTTYRGVGVVEMPPSTQGLVALEMLNILEGFDIAALGHNTADTLHLLAEARRIAFADRGAYLADRASVPAGVLDVLLSKSYAARRRAAIDMARAADAWAPGVATPHGDPQEFSGRDRGDTVYLAAADADGTVVSLIQSLFAGFGSGLVAGDTGVVLQNRGAGFVLTPDHPNRIAPRKRPLHTLVPAMLLRNGRPWGAFGVMGGDNQAQAHAQIVMNLVDFGLHVQQAGEAARVRHLGTALAVEDGIDAAVQDDLRRRGHLLQDGRGQMGGYQAVLIDPESGVLMGGSDPRKDGLAIGW